MYQLKFLFFHRSGFFFRKNVEVLLMGLRYGKLRLRINISFRQYVILKKKKKNDFGDLSLLSSVSLDLDGIAGGLALLEIL